MKDAVAFLRKKMADCFCQFYGDKIVDALYKKFESQINVVGEKIVLRDLKEYNERQIQLACGEVSKFYAWMHVGCPMNAEIPSSVAILDNIEHDGAKDFARRFTYPARIVEDKKFFLRNVVRQNPLRCLLLLHKSQAKLFNASSR